MPAASGCPEAATHSLLGGGKGGDPGEEEGARATEPAVPDQWPGDPPQVLSQGQGRDGGSVGRVCNPQHSGSAAGMYSLTLSASSTIVLVEYP